MVAQYIVTRPILDLCEEAVQRPGTQFYKSWWEQEGLDLEGEWGRRKRQQPQGNWRGAYGEAEGEAEGVAVN